MKFTETHLKGCYIIEPRVFQDTRGYFFESFNQKVFNEGVGEEVNFVQDNQSFSSKGVLRGFHYQRNEFAQAKLVRVLSGAVLDVVIDIRPESPTFGQHLAVELTEENQLQLYIPRGFAHGFLVRSNTASFFYKCDNFYNKESEAGILYSDPKLNIDWNFNEGPFLVSEKDEILPLLANALPIW